MTFNPNIPTSGEKLSASQPVLLSNNQALDNTFEVDHYKFSDGTSNVGKHETVTTPGIAIPSTTIDPKIYGHEVTTNVGTLQFSRGESNAIPTPLTNKSGIVASLPFATPVNLLDFTGVTTCNFRVSAFRTGSSSFATFSGSVTGGTLFNTVQLAPSGATTFTFPISGNILQILTGSPATNVFWCIEFLRIE